MNQSSCIFTRMLDTDADGTLDTQLYDFDSPVTQCTDGNSDGICDNTDCDGGNCTLKSVANYAV